MKILSRSFKIVVLILSIQLLIACSAYYTTTKKVERIKKIALVSTVFGKYELPIIPLIDAGIFNKKVKSIDSQIIDLEKKYVGKYRKIVAQSLANNFNCEVVYGDSLQLKTKFKEFKDKYNSVNDSIINENNFPFLITEETDISPFVIGKGSYGVWFDNPTKYKGIISELCKMVDADILAISYSNFRIDYPEHFGRTADLMISSRIRLIDKEGDIISIAAFSSKGKKIAGNDIDQYQVELDNLPVVIEPALQKMKLKLYPK